MKKFCVIIAAAGQSSRFNDPMFKKPFAILNGKAVWLHSVDQFLKRDDVGQVIVVVADEDRQEFTEKFGANIAINDIDLVIGGQQRSDSVANALAMVRDQIDFVAIHDAARPCIDQGLIDRVFSAAVEHEIAIPTIPVFSTLKKSADGKRVDQTVDRTGLYMAQTPQVFRREHLVTMFERRGELQPTDEAQLAEALGYGIEMVAGSRLNIKITTKEDLRLAGIFLNAAPAPKFDAPLHPFQDGTERGWLR